MMDSRNKIARMAGKLKELGVTNLSEIIGDASLGEGIALDLTLTAAASSDKSGIGLERSASDISNGGTKSLLKKGATDGKSIKGGGGRKKNVTFNEEIETSDQKKLR
jgi:hypothetical protein